MATYGRHALVTFAAVVTIGIGTALLYATFRYNTGSILESPDQETDNSIADPASTLIGSQSYLAEPTSGSGGDGPSGTVSPDDSGTGDDSTSDAITTTEVLVVPSTKDASPPTTTNPTTTSAPTTSTAP